MCEKINTFKCANILMHFENVNYLIDVLMDFYTFFIYDLFKYYF